MVKSTSPLAAPISAVNFSHTPSNIPSRLLSANVFRKFLTMSPLSMVPMCLCNSSMIWDLSPGVKVGAVRMTGSFGSFLKTSERLVRALEVLSKEEVLAEAVYYSY